MDLVSSIAGLQQSAVMSQIQYRVARKILDMQQLQGSAAVELIDAASSNFNRAGDALAAAASGLGGQLDIYG